MANAVIEFEYTSTIRVNGSSMRYVLSRVPPTALAPRGKRLARAPVVVEIIKWPGFAPKKGRRHTFLSRDGGGRVVPPPIQRLIFDLLQLKELPRRFSLTVAWVSTDYNLPNNELVVYDCIRWDRHAVLHGMFAEGASGSQDVLTLATNIACPLPAWARRAAFVAHDVRITQYKERADHQVDITIVDRCRFYRYPLGEYCPALPLPPFPENFNDNPKNAVLVATAVNDDGKLRFQRAPLIWKTLQRINQVVRSPEQTILLTGTPGSGKELYAKAIHHLSGHVPKAPFGSISTAGLPFATLREFLTGSVVSGGYHIHGDIAKADGGTLMLDEFDKACADPASRAAFYKWLLRVLEAKEYRPEPGTTTIECKNVCWILAGAFVAAEEEIPRDFWSRLSGEIKLPDFDASDGAVVAMLLYWWFIKALANMENLSPADLVDGSNSDFKMSLVRMLVLDTNPAVASPHPEVLTFAWQFAKALSDDLWSGANVASKKKALSARTIRQAAQAGVQELLFRAKGVDTEDIWSNGARNDAMEAAMYVTRISLKAAGEI